MRGMLSAMLDWTDQLAEYLGQHDCLAMVTVLQVDGSVPRRPGARMLVGPHSQSGTIGGGNLEFQASKKAREMLSADNAAPVRQQFHLGPTLGQCCGGRVEVLFELVSRRNLPRPLPRQAALKRAIDGTDSTVFEIADLPSIPANQDNGRLLISRERGCTFLTEAIYPNVPDVWVLGAGHVGQAVVKQLALLPCRIYWLDEREHMYTEQLPPSVTAYRGDAMVDELAHAPDQTSFIVMTHSHALDFEVCHLILQRSFSYAGLIGSATKRKNFTRRLLERGLTQEQVARLVCPVGCGSVRSNEPHAIALSLAHQLLNYWHSTRATDE